jgi:hypothetical protein
MILAVELLARAKDGEGVKSGPLGLAAILVLCVACYFLFKSMSKHLKKVREEFPTDQPAPKPIAPMQSSDSAQSSGDAPAVDVPPASESP